MPGRRNGNSADPGEKSLELGDAGFQGKVLIVVSLASLADTAPLFRGHRGETRHRVRLPSSGRQARRGAVEELVADAMSEHLVDLAEAVECDDEHRQQRTVFSAPRHRFFEPLVEKRSVGQTGELVASRPLITCPPGRREDRAEPFPEPAPTRRDRPLRLVPPPRDVVDQLKYSWDDTDASPMPTSSIDPTSRAV